MPTFNSTYGSNYEIFFRDGYYYSFQGTNLTTSVPAPDINITTAYGGYFIKWSSAGTSTNFTTRMVSNVSVVLPRSFRTIYQISDYGNARCSNRLRLNDQRATTADSSSAVSTVTNLIATDLTTGRVLWNYTSPVSEMSSAYRPTNAWVRNGRYIAEMERGYIEAWDLRTGRELWKCEIDDVPWGEFWMYDEAAYLDLVYATGYTGTWAINETTGAVVWRYADPAIPFETPYTSDGASTYTVQNIRVIGGLVYVANSEHTPSQPATRGWGMMCLDGLTGELQWKLSGTAMSAGAVGRRIPDSSKQL